MEIKGSIHATQRLTTGLALTLTNWVTAKDYLVDDLIVESGVQYLCIMTHTSSALFATDAVNWSAHATLSNINSAVSGTTGHVPYFSGTNAITSEAGFAYDDTTNTLSSPIVDVTTSYNVAGTKVVGAQGASITDPTAITSYTAHAAGGVTVTSNAATDLDTTAAAVAILEDEVTTLRTTVVDLISRLEAHGLIATI